MRYDFDKSIFLLDGISTINRARQQLATRCKPFTTSTTLGTLVWVDGYVLSNPFVRDGRLRMPICVGNSYLPCVDVKKRIPQSEDIEQTYEMLHIGSPVTVWGMLRRNWGKEGYLADLLQRNDVIVDIAAVQFPVQEFEKSPCVRLYHPGGSVCESVGSKPQK